MRCGSRADRRLKTGAEQTCSAPNPRPLCATNGHRYHSDAHEAQVTRTVRNLTTRWTHKGPPLMGGGPLMLLSNSTQDASLSSRPAPSRDCRKGLP